MSKNHTVRPSIEMFYTLLWSTCLLLCGVEWVATSSINDKKETATNITRGVEHLCSQSGSIPGQSVLWS